MTSIALLKGTKDKLRELKKELGFRSHDALLNHMALEIRVHRGTIGLCAQIILRTRVVIDLIFFAFNENTIRGEV